MPTNAQVLGEALLNFANLDATQTIVADYIECTNDPECEWDGKTEHLDVCTDCKIRWLEKEYEG